MAVPVGVFSAIYLAEYSKKGSKIVKIIRMTVETLSGIPSIVYGLFGFLAFVIALHWQYSFISGAITLAIMVLPLYNENNRGGDSLRSGFIHGEGSYGLGAGKLRTIFKIIVPSCRNAILLPELYLQIGRIVGETRHLYPQPVQRRQLPENICSSTRTLAVHMYCLLSEGLYIDQAYATAVVLLVMVIIINALSSFLAKKLTKN